MPKIGIVHGINDTKNIKSFDKVIGSFSSENINKPIKLIRNGEKITTGIVESYFKSLRTGEIYIRCSDCCYHGYVTI